tara:strand:- start:183 stop:389 length:207 start_codon:yes stop_codon:yes gene_type:complete
MNKEIKVGTLVYDASPYKAPELLYGAGVVVSIMNSQYVEVHWVEWNITSFENKINLAVLDEDWRLGKT